MYPVSTTQGDGQGPAGYTYAGLLVRGERGAVIQQLSDLRFSGWVGPQEGDWVVLVAAQPGRPVAGGGADLERLAATLARVQDAVVLSATVHGDQLLRLGVWEGEREVGRYVSNPALEAPDDDEVFPEPEGVEHAEEFAAACGKPEVAEELTELLSDPLDEESEIESERLASALRLLGLPRWLVASTALPKDVPGGPSAEEFVRLGAGRPGVRGRAAGWATGLTRRRPGR